MIDSPRRVAVIGANRIPFARSDSAYAHASNQDMLTAALDGLVDRFGLEGEQLGEVAGGAVLKHSRDRDLTRESVLSTRLAPETPAFDVQQACGTGLETAILVANKIALGPDRRRHRLRRGHHLRRADRAQRATARDPPGGQPAALERRQAARAGTRATRATSCRRSPATRSRAPASRWASTARSWPPNGASGAPSRTSWRSASHQQPRGGLRARLLRRPDHPLPRPRARPEPAARLRRREAGEAEAGLRRPEGHDDCGQLDAAQRRRLGGAARQRGVGEGARPAGPRLHHRGADRGGRPRPQARRAADGARLRDAADARPRRARRCRTSTTTRSTRPSPRRCSARWPPGRTRTSARRSSAASSRSARSTAASSTSTAARSPPGTRSRRPAGASSPALAKQLHEDGKGRGVISICAAGGQGVVAVLESAGGAS